MLKPFPVFNSGAETGQIHYFRNGEVNNRVVSFPGPTEAPLLIFVTNWRAKLKHWMSFIGVLQQHYRVLYFETREKAATQYCTEAPDFSLKAMAEDLITFISKIKKTYHLIGVSVGTSVIMRAWPRLLPKPKSLVLLCPVLKVRMPVYFRFFPLIDISTFTRYAPLVYRLMCISPRLKSVRTTLYRAMTEKDFTEIAVMKASVQQLLEMPSPLRNFNCEIGANTLVVKSIDDPIHASSDADEVINGIGSRDSFSCSDFRAVHAAETAQRLLPFLRKYRVLPTA